MGVRWDAVVQHSGFWLDDTRPSREAPAVDPNRAVCVRACLFGSLASHRCRRRLISHERYDRTDEKWADPNNPV